MLIPPRLALLFVVLAGPRLTWAETPAIRYRIEVQGAFAQVQVERPLVFTEVPGGRDELVIGLALPDGAGPVDARIEGDGVSVALDPGRPAARYREDLEVRALGRVRVPWDDDVDVRLRVAARGLGARGRALGLRLTYRYVAKILCRAGRYVLPMPGVVDADAGAARVDVVVANAGTRIRQLSIAGILMPAGRTRGTVQIPARKDWDLWFSLDAAGGLSGVTTAFDSSVRILGCRSEGKPAVKDPAQLMFFIDRSRSVGAAGLALQRDLVNALVEGFPPALTFNAVLFDRTPASLFPSPRVATREALGLLAESLTSGALQNGTDLLAALRWGARLDPGAAAWWVVITDGALTEAASAGAISAAAFSGRTHAGPISVVVMRPPGDDRPAPGPLFALSKLASQTGGVLREIQPVDLKAAARDLVDGVRRGGDITRIQVLSSGTSPGWVKAWLTPALGPGAGQDRVLPWRKGRRSGLGLEGWIGGVMVRAPLRVVGLGSPGLVGPRKDVAGISDTALILLEQNPDRLAPPAVRPGELIKADLRNVLTRAYLPRARACYLLRPVKQRGDRELSGRLRIEVQIERGEVNSAVVTQSTLGRPDIESCLREAAFAVDIPRAVANDTPILAALNLVFQPQTRTQPAVPSPVSEDIDLIIGPLPASDPLQLIEPSDGAR